jgi:hypothetical protein
MRKAIIMAVLDVIGRFVLGLSAALWLAGAATAETLDTIAGFDDLPNFKAIARASSDVVGASWGKCSVTTAIEDAMAWCKDAQTKSRTVGFCGISRLGDRSVAGLAGQSWVDSVESYRQEVEDGWLSRTRQSGFSIEVLAYGGEAEGWDEFIVGYVRFDPNGECMTSIDGGGETIHCTGYGRFAGYLRRAGAYPLYGENVLSCTNGQKTRGESVSIEPGVGFTCLVTPKGRVMAIFGPGAHAIKRTRETFLQAYDLRVSLSGLNRELCGWGLIS